eukprot:404573-Rhodomonas_salina.1
MARTRRSIAQRRGRQAPRRRRRGAGRCVGGVGGGALAQAVLGLHGIGSEARDKATCNNGPDEAEDADDAEDYVMMMMMMMQMQMQMIMMMMRMEMRRRRRMSKPEAGCTLANTCRGANCATANCATANCATAN